MTTTPTSSPTMQSTTAWRLYKALLRLFTESRAPAAWSILLPRVQRRTPRPRELQEPAVGTAAGWKPKAPLHLMLLAQSAALDGSFETRATASWITGTIRRPPFTVDSTSN